MKLTFIATIRFPTERAHGLAIAKMCEAFAKQGIEVELLIPKRRQPFKLLDGDWQEHYGITHEFKVTRLWCPDWLWLDWYLPTFFHPFTFLLLSLSFIIAATFFLRKNQSSVVYTREFLLVPWLVLLGRQVFVEVHNWPESKVILWIYKLFSMKVKGFIYISPSLQQRVFELGISPKKGLLSPSGVDRCFFNKKEKNLARKEVNLPAHKNVVMYVGSPTREKGIETFYQAAKLLKRSKKLFFVIIGDELWPESELKVETELSNVLKTGFQPPTKIPTFLAAADILVLPNSLKWGKRLYGEYTSPLKLYEYLASGRPIVASKIPAIEGIVAGRKHVLFFEPDNSRDLARKITVLLNNKSLAKKMGRATRKLIKKYTWDSKAKQILKFMNKCVSRNVVSR